MREIRGGHCVVSGELIGEDFRWLGRRGGEEEEAERLEEVLRSSSTHSRMPARSGWVSSFLVRGDGDLPRMDSTAPATNHPGEDGGMVMVL